MVDLETGGDKQHAMFDFARWLSDGLWLGLRQESACGLA